MEGECGNENILQNNEKGGCCVVSVQSSNLHKRVGAMVSCEVNDGGRPPGRR